ncbi:major facilitator superfamily domain-containing protein 6-A-like isoform X1 [Adelges cooleyi]|uniref:major facilitator superfamily domain-containing protein 6-A-like isoform X1 n=1 Tax=Adelges cooleyi TaxID=133065 RepID=UPI00217FD5D0|nr:major facilitator superfamily domain-containing protein 6-A-like isoform X1 [Adelges cooleyi]
MKVVEKLNMLCGREINRDLLFMKMNYFFAWGAYAPVIPFCATIGKQRGYSALAMGITLTGLQIPSLIVRPLLGSVTDAYQCRKLMFLIGEVLSALAVLGLIFLPGATVAESIADEIVFNTLLYWVFFFLLFFLYLGCVMRSLMEDTICVSLLGDNVHNYGQQRVWGAIGYGIISIVSGVVVDWFSIGQAHDDFRPGFVIAFICVAFDVYVSAKIKVEQVKKTETFSGNMKTVLTDFRVIVFLIATISFGFFYTFVLYFVTWYLEDITNLHHPEYEPHIKTIQGLSQTIQCFLGEVPFYFVSSYIIKKVGHMNVFSLTFVAYAIRFALYSIIENPVVALSVEIFHGITFALPYSAGVAYAAKLAPVGAEGTMQGLVGMTMKGIGIPMGNFVGGYIIKNLGIVDAFRIFSIGSLMVCIVVSTMNLIVKRTYKTENNVVQTS